MPAYFDSKTQNWFCKFYYKDSAGVRHQKKKRGFRLQREAREWERHFLEVHARTPNTSFSSFASIYLKDMEIRLRKSTMLTKRQVIENRLVSYFGNKPITEIGPVDIRAWQNWLLEHSGYSPTYLKAIHNQLSAMFNYAVKYYGLPQNPSHKCGPIGSDTRHTVNSWTKDAFDLFIGSNQDNPVSYTAFLTLYYTGMRIGELLALTLEDLDTKEKSIHITKSLQRIHREDIITPPKTAKSKRDISIPDFLCTQLNKYITQNKLESGESRLFSFTKYFLHKEIRRGCALSGVPLIRIHDIRHSHASLLIELGFSPLLIAERLGHEKVETTLNIYSHLYPHKQEAISQKLDEIF